MLVALHFIMSAKGGHLQVLLFRGALGFVFMLTGNLLKKPLTDFKWWKIGCAFVLTAVTSAIYLKFSIGNSFYDGVPFRLLLLRWQRPKINIPKRKHYDKTIP